MLVSEISPALRSYAQLIGADKACILAWKCGGRRFRMCRGLPNPEVEAAVGKVAALRLAEHYHRAQLRPPLSSRDVVIYLWREQRWSPQRIAKNLRMSESSVGNILRNYLQSRRPTS